MLFTTLALIIILVCEMAAAPLDQPMPPMRPNVVFIISDDLNDWVGYLNGNPQAQTPHLDQLAKQSFRFMNAHCNAPLCGPSRASLFSGLYPHVTEYYGYGQNKNNHWRAPKLLRDAVMLPQHFQANGYAVFGAGKIMHNSVHQQELFEYDNDDQSGHGPVGNFGPWPWNGKEKMPHPNNKPPFASRFMAGIAPLSEVPSFTADPEKDIPGYTGWRMHWWANEPFHYNGPDDRSMMSDENTAHYAAEIVGKKHERPFLLVAGFYRPHVPWYAPKGFFDLYPLEDVQLPPGFRLDDLEDVAPSNRKASSGWDKLVEHYGVDEGVRTAVQGYLACVSFMDAQVGKVLDALDKGPNADNTIVIFTSDHGYHLWEKLRTGKTTAWERSSQVPLLIRLPGQTTGFDIVTPVELLDLYPTLNTLCKLPESPNANGNGQSLHGDDLTPIFNDPEMPLTSFDAALLVTKDHAESRYTSYPPPKQEQEFTLRSRDFRYILTPEGEEEFYDHRNDPHELTNLIDHPDFAQEIARHREMLKSRSGL